ncbi:hypothetical protein BZG36_02015 [Bifiguratus adelaidae]|uniref:1-(5-phosphoribosyl)-5-[(5-phosphoribosylamino)methylideneamino] imidazole-4-carboxamide isomerase n=1 Tax=Bifiguratus adelaidae TaxID=1938954 RepID=A0A261Y437_9FUNG|nr:hypothetical protein BZG36_02015 [Bifiguratus adelaidae]
MTKFRPCIDLHNGQVKQIVGGSLKDKEPSELKTNFVSAEPPSYYAKLYRQNHLEGAHVIKLGPNNDEAAKEALEGWPDGLQVGGGMTPENAKAWIDAGASKVIVTSYLFPNACFDQSRLEALCEVVGKDRLVIDVSCRRQGDKWMVAMDRWQKITDMEVNKASLDLLARYCSEFLVHAADVEGLCQGIDEDLVRCLGEWTTIPTTYAGGGRSIQDLERVQQLSQGRVDLTIGSALDLFGGGVSFHDCILWNKVIVRFTTTEEFGIASVKLELLLSTILFLSREGFRSALLRGSRTETEAQDKEAKFTQQQGPVILDASSPQGKSQIITNLAYVPMALGALTTLAASTYYISNIHNTSDESYIPYYKHSIICFSLAAYLELLTEPLWIIANNRLWYSARVWAEGCAVALRCLTTFGLTLYGSMAFHGHSPFGVLSFAIGQLVYAISFAAAFILFYYGRIRSGDIQYRLLIPNMVMMTDDHGQKQARYLDPRLLNLSLTMTKQSLLKHLLTEGDKLLISMLSTNSDQGVYALASNYGTLRGSLVARILFAPIEETSRILFAKMLANVPDITNIDAAQPLNAEQQASLRQVAFILSTLIKFHILLGLFFVGLGSNYTSTLIDTLVGSRWSQAGSVLATYCLFVPFMGINGITEAFLQAVASESELSALSIYMIFFSVGFAMAAIFFMWAFRLGAVGLVLANCFNMFCRITYSWLFIQRYFTRKLVVSGNVQIHSFVRLRDCLPQKTLIVCFAAAWMISRLSEVLIGWQTWSQKGKHVGVGFVLGLMLLAVTFLKERSFYSDLQRIVKGKTD